MRNLLEYPLVPSELINALSSKVVYSGEVGDIRAVALNAIRNYLIDHPHVAAEICLHDQQHLSSMIANATSDPNV